MKQFPRVSIIVLNYNGKDDLKKCLVSLFRMDYPNFEVIVVDNNSTDGSLESARKQFAKVSFIKNEHNIGFSAGNNMGIRYALEKMTDYILLLNNDTKVESDFLIKMIKVMEVDRKIGIASPLVLAGDTEEVWFAGGKIDWMRMKTEHLQGSVDFISGCAMLVRTEVFQKIGLFDEDFFLYWEDVDFSVRAKKAGFLEVIIMEAKIRHFEKSEEKKENKVYWLVLSGLIFFEKNAPFFLGIWQRFYFVLRLTKNQWDLYQNKKDKIALAVKKAYKDFNKFKRRK